MGALLSPLKDTEFSGTLPAELAGAYISNFAYSLPCLEQYPFWLRVNVIASGIDGLLSL